MRRHRTKPICLLNEHGIHSLSNLLQIRMRLGLLCKILAVLGSSKTPARIWIDMVDKQNRTSLASRSLVSCQFDSNHCEAHRFTVVHLPFFCFFMFLSYSWKWQQCWALPFLPRSHPAPHLSRRFEVLNCLILVCFFSWLIHSFNQSPGSILRWLSTACKVHHQIQIDIQFFQIPSSVIA